MDYTSLIKEVNIPELVKALRICSSELNCGDCPLLYRDSCSSDQMMRDAAAAIEELQDKISELGESYSANLVAAQNAQPHWVSVEERLPNVDEKVLVFAIGKLDGFIGDTVIALTSMSDTNWLNHHEKVDKPYWLDPWQYFLTDYRITHWMPLPEPPQEVQDGQE